MEKYNRVLKHTLPEDIKLILPEDIVVTTTITLPEGIMDHLFGGGLVIIIVKKTSFKNNPMTFPEGNLAKHCGSDVIGVKFSGRNVPGVMKDESPHLGKLLNNLLDPH